MKKKKILITGYSLGIGGVEKALLGLLNSYDYSLNEVDLLLMNPQGEFLSYVNKEVNQLITPDFFTWILLPKGRLINCIFKLLKHPIILFYFLKNIFWGVKNHSMAQARQRMWKDVINFLPILAGEYDEVLDFSGLMRRYVLEKVTSRYKATWIHSDYRVFGYDKTLDNELLCCFDNIFCVSDTCKLIFDEQFPHLKNKSVVRLNIIDLNFIHAHLDEDGFKDGFNGIRLLDVTRIDPNKGLDIAVKICRKLKDSGLSFRWYILGNDPLGYRLELEKLIIEEDVEDCFILLGFTKNPYPFMNEADIIVHFSRFEGRSVSIDEAMALCKPILLTNYPTAKDQINSGINGIICEFDENQLYNSLLKLISDKEFRLQFSSNLKKQMS